MKHTTKPHIWVGIFLLWCVIVYVVPKSYQTITLAFGLAFHVVIYDKYYNNNKVENFAGHNDSENLIRGIPRHNYDESIKDSQKRGRRDMNKHLYMDRVRDIGTLRKNLTMTKKNITPLINKHNLQYQKFQEGREDIKRIGEGDQITQKQAIQRMGLDFSSRDKETRLIDTQGKINSQLESLSDGLTKWEKATDPNKYVDDEDDVDSYCYRCPTRATSTLQLMRIVRGVY